MFSSYCVKDSVLFPRKHSKRIVDTYSPFILLMFILNTFQNSRILLFSWMRLHVFHPKTSSNKPFNPGSIHIKVFYESIRFYCCFLPKGKCLNIIFWTKYRLYLKCICGLKTWSSTCDLNLSCLHQGVKALFIVYYTNVIMFQSLLGFLCLHVSHKMTYCLCLKSISSNIHIPT